VSLFQDIKKIEANQERILCVLEAIAKDVATIAKLLTDETQPVGIDVVPGKPVDRP
jgi:hypothetical protein